MRKAPGQIVRGRRGGKPIGGKSAERISTPINIPKVVPRESFETYWHPNRAGVELAPTDFLAKLQGMHPDLSCCRAPGNAPIANGPAWVLFYKRPRVTHHLCPGWLMLFSWRNDQGVPQPLDERVLAVLYASSALKFTGGSREYFTRAIDEKQRDAKLSRDRAFQNHRKAKQREFIKSTRISNAGSGSKFALHHDGTLAPGRGQLNWHLENRKRLLPSEMIKAETDGKEARRAADADLKTRIRKDLGIRVK